MKTFSKIIALIALFVCLISIAESAPIISNITATEITSSSVKVSWKTNITSTAQVRYGLTNSYNLYNAKDTRYTLSHIMYLRGLTPGHLYHYLVKSIGGNPLAVSGASDHTFTTLKQSILSCVVIPSYYPKNVSVKDYGAIGNGIHDDTFAIQSAIDFVGGSGGKVFIPAGIYMIDAVHNSLVLRSNMTLKMDSNAILRVIPNSYDTYDLMRMEGAQNVQIYGGILEGDRYKHDYSTHILYHDWGYGININDSNNVNVENVTARYFHGDGFYVYGWYQAATNTKLCGLVSTDNRRQGLSIEWADGVIVKNSLFKNTNGARPEYGIDIEPDSDTDTYVNNVNISTSQFVNNHSIGSLGGGGVQLWGDRTGSDTTNVVVNGVSYPKNSRAAITDFNASR